MVTYPIALLPQLVAIYFLYKSIAIDCDRFDHRWKSWLISFQNNPVLTPQLLVSIEGESEA